MKTKKYVVYCDPGHGWVKVKLSEVVKLGIHDKISSYSYMRGDNVYLEEDCDLRLLVNALKQIGITPKWEERHTDKSSKIRSYHHYSKKQLAALNLI